MDSAPNSLGFSVKGLGHTVNEIPLNSLNRGLPQEKETNCGQCATLLPSGLRRVASSLSHPPLSRGTPHHTSCSGLPSLAFLPFLPSSAVDEGGRERVRTEFIRNLLHSAPCACERERASSHPGWAGSPRQCACVLTTPCHVLSGIDERSRRPGVPAGWTGCRHNDRLHPWAASVP